MDSPVCRKDTDPSLWAFTGTSHPERAVRHPLSISLYFYLSPTHWAAIANKVPKAPKVHLLKKWLWIYFLIKIESNIITIYCSAASLYRPSSSSVNDFVTLSSKQSAIIFFLPFEFLEVISTSFYTQKGISFAFSSGKKRENEWDRKGYEDDIKEMYRAPDTCEKSSRRPKVERTSRGPFPVFYNVKIAPARTLYLQTKNV